LAKTAGDWVDQFHGENILCAIACNLISPAF